MDNVLRIGTVTVVDDSTRQARVFFDEDNMASGWLKVIKSPPYIPAKYSEQRTESEAGGSGDEAFAEHTHKLVITPWMPLIGDTVLCVYNPGFNEDGFILGAI